MRRLAGVLAFLVRLVGGLASALLLLAVVALGWLTLTNGGLRYALDAAEQISGGMLQVEQAEGRLFGTMDLGGIALRTDAARVEIGTLHLSWVPGWMPALTVYVRALQADDISVALFSVEDEDDDEREPLEALDFSLPVGIVLSAVSITNVSVSRDGEALTSIDSLDLIARARGRRARIEQLTLVQADVGTLHLRTDLRMDPGLLTIRRLRLEGPGVLHASGTLPLGGEAPLDLALEWEALHWPAGADADQRLFTSPGGALRLGGALDTPEAEGSLSLYPQGRITLSGHWRGAEGFSAAIDWHDLVDVMNPEAPQWASSEGSLQAEGMPDNWRASLQAAGTVVVPADAVDVPEDVDAPVEASRSMPITLRLRARGNETQATVESIDLGLLEGTVSGNASLRWHPELGGEARLRLAEINPAAFAPDFPGSISGDVSSRFRMRDTGPDLSVEAELRDSQLRGYPLSLTLAMTLREEVLNLQQARLQSGQSVLRASGRATEPYDLSLEVNSPDLEELAPGFAGSATLDATVRGALETLAVRLQGVIEEFAMPGVTLERARIEGNVALDGDSRLRVNLSEVRAAGMDIAGAQLSLDGSIEQHMLRLGAQLPQGDMLIGLAGAADLDAQQWSGVVDQFEVVPAQLEGWRLDEPALLELAADRIDLEPVCMRSRESGALCFRARHSPERSSAAFRLDTLTLNYLHAFMPPGMTLEGRVSGTGEVVFSDGVLTTLRSSVDIGEGTISVPNQPTMGFGPGTLLADREDDGGMRARLDVALAGGQLSGEAGVAEAAPGEPQDLDGEFVLRLPNLDFLPLFTDEVTKATGSLDAGVRIAGTVAAPQPSFNIQLRDVELALYTPGIALTDVRADIVSDANQRLAIDMRATSGEGTITVSGTADIFDGPIRADIRIDGSDFQAVDMPEVRAWISPELRVRVEEKVEITGTVTIPRADIEPQRFSDAGIGPSGDVVYIDEEGDMPDAGMPVHARITVAVGDRVSLVGYGLETRLGGSITVIDEPHRVTRARGALTLEDGRYEAYGQRLAIERGRIVFAGGPVTEPGLDFLAVRTPRSDIRVGIVVRGSIERPEFQLFSEPPMTQNEQLSWLVLGRPPPTGGAQGDEASAMAAAGLALGLTGGEWLAQNVGGRVGFDEISVGADDGEAGSEARLTVGKYIGSRFYVSYGVSLFQRGHIFRMRYDVGRGFAIQTEAGVEAGADLLYTLER